MILALDFDGVLRPVKTTTEPKFCRLELLESWLRKRPDVNVLIASSWREAHPFELLQSLFAEDLQGRVRGVTRAFVQQLAAQAQLASTNSTSC